MKILPFADTPAERSTFVWRDQYGKAHRMGDMEPEYLFNVLRMIWNHAAPPDLRLSPYTRYRFGEFYTPSYMVAAAKAATEELRRCASFLSPSSQEDLVVMEQNYRKWCASALRRPQ